MVLNGAAAVERKCNDFVGKEEGTSVAGWLTERVGWSGRGRGVSSENEGVEGQEDGGLKIYRTVVYDRAIKLSQCGSGVGRGLVSRSVRLTRLVRAASTVSSAERAKERNIERGWLTGTCEGG